TGMENTFERKKHIRFFTRILQILPSRYAILDTSRLTVAFFALSGLGVLDALDAIPDKDKQEIIEWIYTLQVVGNKASDMETTNNYDCSHIAMTYTGLASLLILGDDLRRVNKHACLEGIKALQLPDGSFKSSYDGSENDMRFIYCACCVCTMLDDFSAINQATATNFIMKSLCHDGAFGQGPGHESHGGSTYCACASLQLMGRLTTTLSPKQLKRLEYWCISRQRNGFNGRPHKDDDTCYSFWVGASLKILGIFDLVDFKENENFVLSTQDIIVGGFAKWPQINPGNIFAADALHSYMGVCGLALMSLHSLQPVDPTLNISERARLHMQTLHE
uniref:Geranylgeranyl transferase type-1 subunit beta n=1 Tax=Ciona savignyi TaxID=51511 RepID=H2YT29_CIOSA